MGGSHDAFWRTRRKSVVRHSGRKCAGSHLRGAASGREALEDAPERIVRDATEGANFAAVRKVHEVCLAGAA